MSSIHDIEDATRHVRTDGTYYYKSATGDPTYNLHLEHTLYQAQGIPAEIIHINGEETLKIPNLGTRITSLEENLDRLLPLLEQFSNLPATNINLHHFNATHYLLGRTEQLYKQDPERKQFLTELISSLTPTLNTAAGEYLQHGDVSVRNLVEDTHGNLHLIDFETVTLANPHHDSTAIHYFNARKTFRDTLQKLTSIYSNPTTHQHMGRFEIPTLKPEYLVAAVTATGYTLEPHVPLNKASLLYYFLRSTTYRMALSGGGPDIVDHAIAQYFNLYRIPQIHHLLELPGKNEIVAEKECYTLYTK